MTRYIAKNIVASGLVEKCEIHLSYAIGVAKPTTVMVDTFGTCAGIGDKTMEELVYENFKLTMGGIIEILNLKEILYKPTAKYGYLVLKIIPDEKEI